MTDVSIPPLPDDDVLRAWVQHDLSAADLPPMYEAEDLVRRALGILASGRSLIVMGPAGTGKTALVHELVRRGQGPKAIPALQGRRVVQISLRARLTALKKPNEDMGPAFNELVEALFKHRKLLIPYFRDAAMAYRFDLESALQALAEGMGGPVILEGPDSEMKQLLEYQPELTQVFVPMTLEEPSLARAGKIVAQWSAAQPTAIDEEAQDTAIALSHRFLARDRFPRKALQLLDSAAHTGSDDLSAAGVLDHFCEVHQVPRHLVDPAIPLDLQATERHFRDRLLGQPDAVSAVLQMIALLKAGLSDVRRPFGVFLFVGPTGVGKTHLAQLLASYLFGSEDRLIRLNMADYQSPTDALVLFGNPEHHRQSLRRGVLTNRLVGHPFAVVLFDELEKAHQSVIDRFLQLMDEGSFINGAGETVSARSTIVIATSNAGAEVYGGRLVGFAGTEDPNELDRKLDRALETAFRIEFLNRFDHVVRFRPLTRAHIRDIARRELRLLRHRPGLRRRDVHLEADEAVLDWLTAHGYDPRHGARFLRRVVERNVTTAVARSLVRHPEATDQTLRLTVRQGSIVPRFEDRPTAKAPKVESSPAIEANADWSTRARAALDRATPLSDALAHDRAQRTALLERINAEGFYQAPDRADVLKRFRALDVAVEGDQRDQRAVTRLEERLEQDRVTARSVLDAEAALDRWEERRTQGYADRVWLILSRGDALDAEADPFLGDVMAILEAWCQRSGLESERVAVHRVHDKLQRVILEVHGPAAEVVLSAEVGVHRLHRTDGPDRRVCVVTLPVNGAGADVVDIHRRKRKTGPFDVPVRCVGQIDAPSQTLIIEGSDSEIVAQAAADLASHWDRLHPTELARIYAADGVGARDPRTGASVRRFKDLRRGKLQPFLDAFRAHERGQGG